MQSFFELYPKIVENPDNITTSGRKPNFRYSIPLEKENILEGKTQLICSEIGSLQGTRINTLLHISKSLVDNKTLKTVLINKTQLQIIRYANIGMLLISKQN